jgi:hypothetical protein
MVSPHVAIATKKTTERFLMIPPPCFKSDVFMRNIARERCSARAWVEGVQNVNDKADDLCSRWDWRANINPLGLPPIKKRQAEEHTRAMVLHSTECMEYVLTENRECKEEPLDALRPLLPIKHTYAINSDGKMPQNDSGPSQYAVLDTWTSAIIDACTVYMQIRFVMTIPIMRGRCPATSHRDCTDYNFLQAILPSSRHASASSQPLKTKESSSFTVNDIAHSLMPKLLQMNSAKLTPAPCSFGARIKIKLIGRSVLGQTDPCRARGFTRLEDCTAR